MTNNQYYIFQEYYEKEEKDNIGIVLGWLIFNKPSPAWLPNWRYACLFGNFLYSTFWCEYISRIVLSITPKLEAILVCIHLVLLFYFHEHFQHRLVPPLLLLSLTVLLFTFVSGKRESKVFFHANSRLFSERFMGFSLQMVFNTTVNQLLILKDNFRRYHLENYKSCFWF